MLSQCVILEPDFERFLILVCSIQEKMASCNNGAMRGEAEALTRLNQKHGLLQRSLSGNFLLPQLASYMHFINKKNVSPKHCKIYNFNIGNC
jgi:hypothetical protein